jgi:uncharacterized protein with HEPN domain
LAISKALEIIGEAAARISAEMRTAHPEIPWSDIIGMRNRLVHEYLRVDLRKVSDTARDDIPPLIALIEPLEPPENP